MKELREFVLTLVCVLCLAGCGTSSEDTANTFEGNLKTEEQSETNINNEADDTLVEEAFDIAISHSYFVDVEEEVYIAPLNSEKLSIDSVHLPVYKFDTWNELEQFKQAFRNDEIQCVSYYGAPSLDETTADYDEKFFDENTLILVYIGASSGSYRFDVESVRIYETTLFVHVEETEKPDVVTCDVAGWLITVAVPDSIVENCTEFDADLSY